MVADTRLAERNETNDLEANLSNWQLIKRFDSKDGIAHMGLIMLQSCSSKKDDIVRNIVETKFYKTEKGKKITHTQVMTVSFLKYHLTSAFIYIRQTPSETETLKLEQYLKSYDLVMGDLNLDAYRTEDLQKIKMLSASIN